MLQNSLGIIYMESQNKWDKKRKVRWKDKNMSNGKAFAFYICQSNA